MKFVKATLSYNKEMFTFIVPEKGKTHSHCAKGLWSVLDKSVSIPVLTRVLKDQTEILKSDSFDIPFGPAEPIWQPGKKRPLYCLNVGVVNGICTLAEASRSILIRSHYTQLARYDRNTA